MRSDFIIKSLLVPVLFVISTAAQADIDEIFQLSIGTTLSRFDTEVTFSSKDGSISESINLEDLGLDSDSSSVWINAWYRFGDRHRLSVSYTPTTRSAFLQTQKDIEVGGDTIKAGAALSTSSRADIWDINYIYSIVRRPDLEIGLSAGVYWLRFDTELLAAGEVQGPNDPAPVAVIDYQTKEKLSAPLPLFGLSLDYEIMDSWRLRAGARYFALTIDEIDGSIFAADIGTDYFFTKSLGVGLGLTSAKVDVDATSIIFEGEVDWGYSSAQLYLVYKY